MVSDRGTLPRGAVADQQASWAEPTAPGGRRMPSTPRERKPALAALAVLLVALGAVAAGYLVINAGHRVGAVEITQQVGQGQRIPASAIKEVEIASNSGVNYVPWQYANRVAGVYAAVQIPAGGDLVYRFPAVGGGHLDPRRGVLSLAVVARRGMQPQQVWEHVQKLHGGLDVLAGVTNAEQGAGLSLLWGPIGKALASMPQADVIADCGRLGADGPLYDLLAEATTVVLVTKVHVADVIRLRDRAAAFAAAAQTRGRRNFGVGVVVVADHKKFRASVGEVQHVLGQANAPATVLGGIAHDTKGADLLSGEWGGSLDRP